MPFMLSDISKLFMLSVIMLNVFRYAECLYAESRYAECRGALLLTQLYNKREIFVIVAGN